jgi:4-hydroxy-3-methylbut-2-enyl diphosphate reductase
MTDFGAFIDLSNGLEGLLHISEVSKEKIKKLESVLSIGQELNVKIVKIEPEARKIGLSLKGIENAPEQAQEKPQEEQADAGVTENVDEEKTDDVKEEDNT